MTFLKKIFLFLFLFFSQNMIIASDFFRPGMDDSLSLIHQRKQPEQIEREHGTDPFWQKEPVCYTPALEVLPLCVFSFCCKGVMMNQFFSPSNMSEETLVDYFIDHYFWEQQNQKNNKEKQD